MFAGRVKVVSHSSCRTSAIFKYFCPLARNAIRHRWVKLLLYYTDFQVVKLIKTADNHPVTAAIGDGANDVSMIQEADVGLGKSCSK